MAHGQRAPKNLRGKTAKKVQKSEPPTNLATQGSHKRAPAKVGRCRHPAAAPDGREYSGLTAPVARSNAPTRADRSHGRLKAMKRLTTKMRNCDARAPRRLAGILTQIFEVFRKSPPPRIGGHHAEFPTAPAYPPPGWQQSRASPRRYKVAARLPAPSSHLASLRPVRRAGLSALMSSPLGRSNGNPEDIHNTSGPKKT